MNTVQTPRVFQVTWPVLVQSLLFMLMGSADTFMLGHVSSDAVAAVGACNQVVNLVLLLFNTVSAGSAVLITQYLGAKRIEECAKFTGASFTLNFALGILVSAMLFTGRNIIAHLLHLPPEVVRLVDVYMSMIGSTIFVQALLGTVSTILQSNGMTRVTMFVTFGMNIVHIIGNYLFIYGAFGVPKLGVEGVAISTSVSRLLALVALMAAMYRMLPYHVPFADYIRIHRDHAVRILKVGIPSAGEPIAYEVSQLVMMGFMGTYGATVLATRVYAQNLMFYIATFGYSLGFGTQIVVGHLCGAGKLEEAYRLVWRTQRMAFALAVVLSVAIACSSHSLFHIFTSSHAVIDMSTQLMFICIILEPGRTFNIVIIQSMRAAGDVKFPVLMGMIFPIGMGLPLSYFLGIHLHMALAGVWWTICLDEWVRAVIMSIRWRSKVWQSKVLVQPKFSDAEAATL
ncbi:MATE family efflux transporter [Alicyclobacillus acidiphilus]|uniref:MATE family efflux transporter n=1 Tax=Alicyclobacillus acidiphilus TaxID=182455 RepID=UPI00082BAB56|nr:MATE family efflux transporter [Alicyclobacillus acidiphilus]